MSRKRANKQHSKKPQAVPEEILAEGSGPHGPDAPDAPAADVAADASPASAAEAPVMAEDGTLAVSVSEPAIEAPALETAAAEIVTPAPARGTGKKRGKRAAASAGAEPADEVLVVAELDAVALVPELIVSDEIDPADAPIPDEGVTDAGDLGELDDNPNDALTADGEAVEGELLVAEGEDAELGATLPTSAASMDARQLKHLVEALVFASDKPVTLQRLRQLTRVADVRRLEAALAELATDFADRGLILQQVSGGYQFRTQTRYSGWVQQLIAGRPVRLSRAQLETLAIIAYRQPITRPEIDEIRGVDSSGTLKVLLDRTLVRILGKREEVGRPMLYGTTKEFLDFFSLGDLRELPTLREYSELTPESKRVITDKLGADEPAAVPTELTSEMDPAFADGSAGIAAEAEALVDELDDTELRAENVAPDVAQAHGAPAASSPLADAAPEALAAEVEALVAAGEALAAEAEAEVADVAAELEVVSDQHAAAMELAPAVIEAETALRMHEAEELAAVADDAPAVHGEPELHAAPAWPADAPAAVAQTDQQALESLEAEAGDALADPALLAEAAAVARALSADHDDVDTEIGTRDAEDLEAAPPLDPSDDLLAEPDPRDEIVD